MQGAIAEASTGIAATSKAADKLGLSYTSMLAMQQAAGDGADAIQPTFAHLSKDLFAASAGSEEARQKFTRLGVDWSKLAASSPEEQIRQIADRIKDASTPTSRLALEMDLLGKSGSQLDGVFSKGSEGLDQWRARLEATGQALSDEQARMVRAAGIAEKLAAAEIKGMMDKVAASEALHNLAIAEEHKGGMLEGMAKHMPMTTRIIFGDANEDTLAAVKGRFKEQADKMTKSDPAADAARALDTSIQTLEKDLRQQVNTFGMSAAAMQRYKLATEGATDAQLKMVDALTAEKRVKELDKLSKDRRESFANKIADQTMDPLDKIGIEMGKLDSARDNKLITEDQRTLGIADLYKKSGIDNLSDRTIQTPQALIEGSAAAYSAVTQAGQEREDPSTRVQAAIARHIEISKLQLEESRKIADALANGIMTQAVR
jgi:hypothetical protein